jgi:hypothetical protein
MISIAVLTLGSLWEAPTALLALGSAYFFATVAVILTNTVTPPRGDVVKGFQRARKLSGSRVPGWSDLSTNKLIVAAFAGVTAATIAIGLTQVTHFKENLAIFDLLSGVLLGAE